MKSNKRIRFYVLLNCLIIGMFILFVTSQSMATTYCVANDAELITALNNARDNGEDDAIKIQQGTYYGNFVYTSTESFGITLEGGYSDALCINRDVDPVNTVLDGGELGVVLALSNPILAVNFVVEGLTLQNGDAPNNSGGGLHAVTNYGTLTLTNNIISNNNGVSVGGVYLDTSTTVTLNNNTISNNTGRGIYLYSFTATLTNNTISNNTGDGLWFVLNTATLTNNTICNNTGRGIYLHGPHTATLTNNTICNNTGDGLRLELPYYDAIVDIYNNIIWENSLYIDNDPNNKFLYCPVDLLNNDFDQENGFFIKDPDFIIHSSNLDNVDPSFVDFVDDDYHLKEGSVLINAGNDGAPGLPLTDKDGNPRKVGSAVDIGAYEYQGFVAPIATFMASPLAGVAPLTVEFFNESTGSIDSWYWDFGDGNDSTLQHPTNTYNVAGTYSVSLTVTGDSVSDEDTKTDYITVVSPDAPALNGRVKEFHMLEFGEKIVVKLQVENSGNTKADPFDVAFYLSNNGITQDELLGVESVNGGLNSQRTKVVSLRYESEISLSGKYIIAVIDPDGRVLELDETNNYFSVRIP